MDSTSFLGLPYIYLQRLSLRDSDNFYALSAKTETVQAESTYGLVDAVLVSYVGQAYLILSGDSVVLPKEEALWLPLQPILPPSPTVR